MSSEEHDSIVAAFREFPGQFSKIAKICKIAVGTATTAWKIGWPRRGWPSVQSVVEGEQFTARAQLISEKGPIGAAPALNATAPELARERALAGADSIGQRVEEAKSVRLARSTSQAAMGAAANLLAGYHPLAQKAKAKLEAMAQDGRVSPQEIIALGKDIASVARTAILAAQTAMEMERLALGEPTAIVEHTAGARVSEMTPEEALERLEAARLAVQDAQQDKLRLVASNTQVDGEVLAKSG